MKSKDKQGEKKYAKWVRIRGSYKHRWWMKPLCWLKGHKKVWTSAFGIRYRQCKRCGKDFWAKKIIEMERKLLFKGEIGELYGVRFIQTKRK